MGRGALARWPLKYVIGPAQGLNEMVQDWVRERIGLKWGWPGCSTVSLWQDCELIAAVVYEDYSVKSIQCHIAGIHGRRWMTKNYLHAIFTYPFTFLKVERITVCIAAENTDSREFVEHLGFKLEGVLRKAAPEPYTGDLTIYGMLREECRFLEMKHGKVKAAEPR